MIVIGAPMVFHSCYIIYSVWKFWNFLILQITKQTRSASAGHGVKGTYIRLFTFLFIYFLNICFLFGYKFYTYAYEDQWYQEFENE